MAVYHDRPADQKCEAAVGQYGRNCKRECNDFQDEIADLKNKLKDLISKSARVKKEILDKILLIPNNERREILIKRYLENKAVVTISKEMFMTYQGIYYHLDIGEKEIEKLF